MDAPPRVMACVRASAVAGVLGLAVFIAHAGLGLGGRGFDFFANNWLYNSLVGGAAIACFARGLAVRADRAVWLLFGVGLACNAAGEIYYTFAFGESGNPPIPSIADGLYLAYYPCVYAAIVLLVRRQLVRFSASTWLDGAIAATATAALVAATVVQPVAHLSHGEFIKVATNLAYPIGDLVLLSIVVTVFALSAWRPSGAWLFLGIALMLGAIGDSIYVYQNAAGTYTVGGMLDAIWPTSAVATAFAAWRPPAVERKLRLEGMRLLVVPAVFATMALGILIYGGVGQLDVPALALAGAALVLVIVRGGWTFRENLRLLEDVRRDSVTDALTELGNRRRLVLDLDAAVASASAADPWTLVMFDLNGFKAYNDRFGHMAGDMMLAHLGRNLAAAVASHGSAYRLGGDEFCVLAAADANQAKPMLAAAMTALSSSGEGFTVSAAMGTVAIPREAESATGALRLADDRMYDHKGVRRAASARQQAQDVLLTVLREREPDLHDHGAEVRRLAFATGRAMDVQGEDLDALVRAAELHDIGKTAIPDDVLGKPGPLTDQELAFIRRHTIIGERILAAAPALGPVALLVRASHERWDGTGYPDRLAGERIPLGARIIAVCDAFHAMISERPYAAARTTEEAIEELQRSAGSHFDPAVVEAFTAAWASGEQPAAISAEPAGTSAS